MDISSFISSAIIPKPDDTSQVLFPSFSWFCETVMYWGESRNLKNYWKKELFPHFRTSGIKHNIPITIFASSFFWYVGVRVINTAIVYQEKLFLIEEWEFFSLELMGKWYFVFIYTNFDWKKNIYTNLQDNAIFIWKFENDTFSVINSLTELTVFEKNISYGDKKLIYPKWEIIDKYTLWCMKDYFSQEFNIFIENCIKILNLQYLKKWPFYVLTFTDVSNIDISRLIGFLGKYNCILHDDSLWIDWYLTIEKAWDNNFELPNTFQWSDSMDIFDPRWELFRTGLLEISYMEYILTIHIELLKWWMESIDNLKNEQILFQYKRLELTLSDAEILYTRYQKQKLLLTNLLKQKIS